VLYLITNRKIIGSGNLYSIVLEALRGGTKAVILREKDLSYEELLPIAFKLRNITNSFGAELIVNGSLRVAEISNAHYFHIGMETFEKQRPDLKGVLFGLSVHSVEEAIKAQQYGAKYILASHIFKTKCKKGLDPKGIKLIKDIKTRINIPVIALGGINDRNIQEVIEAGADGIAVMSYIMSSQDPYASSKRLTDKIKAIC
jgi:thiamine-phosphate pyrophosphorylase